MVKVICCLLISFFPTVSAATDSECVKNFMETQFQSAQKTVGKFINLLINSDFAESEKYLSPETRPDSDSNGQFMEKFLANSEISLKELESGKFVGNDLLINHKNPNGIVIVYFFIQNDSIQNDDFLLKLYVRTFDQTISRMDITSGQFKR